MVLSETATAWASVLDGRGFVARYGGEEFTALLPQLTGPDAHPILVRMLHAVTHGQTCSIGAATWDGVEEPASLVARADRALYRAKHAGRDRIASITTEWSRWEASPSLPARGSRAFVRSTSR